jgi:hypothetical protein
MGQEFEYDVFTSHSAKDKAVVRPSSLSASIGERAGMRCRSLDLAERLRTCRAEAAGRRRKNALKRSQCRFQPSAVSLQPFTIGSLTQFLYTNWRPTIL